MHGRGAGMSTATGPLRSFLLWCEHIQGPLFMFLLSAPPGVGNPLTAASLHSPYPAPAPLGSKARPWPRTPELPLGNIKIPAAISNSSSHVHLQCCVLVSISWFVWFFFFFPSFFSTRTSHCETGALQQGRWTARKILLHTGKKVLFEHCRSKGSCWNRPCALSQQWVGKEGWNQNHWDDVILVGVPEQTAHTAQVPPAQEVMIND